MLTKHLKVIIASGALFFGVVACNDGENKNGNGDSATVENSNPVDSAKEVNDNRLADSVESDADYLVEAAHLGMKEVESSKWAQKHAVSQTAKNFASMMVTEHTAMNKKVKALAAQKNITLPDSIPHDEMENIRNNDKKDAEFDRDYMSRMVDDHEKAIDKFERAADKAKDADIKKLFVDGLPSLKKHLEMAKTAKDKVDKSKDNNKDNSSKQ